MPFQVPTFAQIRDQYLQAVVNQDPAAAIAQDSDHYVRACAAAAVAEGIYAHQAWVFRQAFPDLADADVMEKMANQQGLTRKPAAPAGGTVRFFGTPGTPISIGQQVFTAQGVYFSTAGAGAIGGGGTVDLLASAAAAGAAANQANNTPATVNAPPSGVAGAATLITMTGGDDVESDASLLERLLLELSEEAQGGNAIDYVRWARSVPGVSRAYVFPTRRGAGTVDVVPMPSTGLPGAPLLAAVQAVLDVKRPVGMLPTNGVLALAPTPVVTDVTATLTIASGYTLAGLGAALSTAIQTVFVALKPGDAVVRNELITALMNVPGVTDVNLVAPAANVPTTVDATNLQLATKGVVTLT